MKLWLTVTTTTPSSSDISPDKWSSLCASGVNYVAGLISDPKVQMIVKRHSRWNNIVQHLAVINGAYDPNTADRIWILALTRQDLFDVPKYPGLKSDVYEMFASLPGSPSLPPHVDAEILRANHFVSRYQLTGPGSSFEALRTDFSKASLQAIPNSNWTGPGHPAGKEVATFYP